MARQSLGLTGEAGHERVVGYRYLKMSKVDPEEVRLNLRKTKVCSVIVW